MMQIRVTVIKFFFQLNNDFLHRLLLFCIAAFTLTYVPTSYSKSYTVTNCKTKHAAHELCITVTSSQNCKAQDTWWFCKLNSSLLKSIVGYINAAVIEYSIGAVWNWLVNTCNKSSSFATQPQYSS